MSEAGGCGVSRFGTPHILSKGFMQFSLKSGYHKEYSPVSIVVIALTVAFLGVLFIPALSLADQSLEKKRMNMNFFEDKLPSTNIFDSKKEAEVVHVVNEEAEGQNVEIVDGALPVEELELKSEDKLLRKQPLETIDHNRPAKSRPASEKQPLRIELREGMDFNGSQNSS